MALISRVLLAILFHLLVRSLKGQELTAEVLSVKLSNKIRYTSSIYDGKDSIYIIGGDLAEGTDSREILKLSLSDNSLTQVALLPSPRYAGSSVIDDEGENIYFFGGDDGNDATREIYKFNLSTNLVTLVGNLAFQSRYSGGVKYTDQFSSKVFLIGGYPNDNLIQCWDIDLNSNCPTKTIDTNFRYTSAVSNGNEAFVFGDANFTSGADPVYRVNFDSFETSFGERTLPDLNWLPAAVIVGSNAYIIGGWSNQTNFPTNSIIQVDLVSLEVINLPVSNFLQNKAWFFGASAVYVEKLNRIYVIGGSSYLRHDEIWSIDLTPISPTTTEQISSPPPTSTTIDPSLFTCDNKPDGFYPHPFDCAQFIGCHNGATDYFTCPNPFLFNPLTGACDAPGNVNCDISCIGKPDGFYQHPQDCSFFIYCNNSTLSVHKCPEPLLFDPIEAKCNYPDLVQCLVQ